MSFSEWKKYKLGKICTKIGSGATPRGGQEAYLESGEYALIRSQNVLDFTFSYNGLAFINEEQANKLNNVALEKNDVLLNITGDSVARVCQVPNSLLPARVNQHVAIIRPQKDILDNFFLKYYLLNPNFKNLLLNISSVGATRNAITKGMIEDLEINLPDLKTQQRIASILSSLDDAIELNQQINKTLEEMAKAIYKEWFVDFNYPNATGKFQETEVGKIPAGWKVYTIGDLVDTISETYKFGKKEKIIFLNTGDILEGKFLHRNYSKIASLPGQAKKSIKINDILFSEIRPENKRFAFVNFDADEYVVSTKLMVLRSKKINPLLIYFLLTREEILKQLQHLAESRSGTFPQITFNQLKDLKISLPNDETLDKFIKYLEGYYNQSKQIIEENQSLINLRDTLLPKLMKGEIEIK